MKASGPKNRTDWKNEIDKAIPKPVVKRTYKPLPGQMALFDIKKDRGRDPTEDEVEQR